MISSPSARFDWFGYEEHLSGNYQFNATDIKWEMYETRRLGLIPVVTEANCNYAGLPGGISPPLTTLQAQQYCANKTAMILYYMMIYGGLKDFSIWTNDGLSGQLLEGLWFGNQKTSLFRVFETLVANVTPATTWPTAHRLLFAGQVVPAATTSNIPTGTPCASDTDCTGLIGNTD